IGSVRGGQRPPQTDYARPCIKNQIVNPCAHVYARRVAAHDGGLGSRGWITAAYTPKGYGKGFAHGRCSHSRIRFGWQFLRVAVLLILHQVLAMHNRKCESKDTPLPYRRFSPDGTVMRLDNALGNCQAETAPAGLARRPAVHLVKAIKDA